MFLKGDLTVGSEHASMMFEKEANIYLIIIKASLFWVPINSIYIV